MRNTSGVEQRLIQNKKGFTALHLALMYSKNLSEGDLDALIDEQKEVLCMPSVKGLITVTKKAKALFPATVNEVH